jgi:hypothetical protein
MEETLILLRFNCPDPECDYIANGWSDLRLHVRGMHGKLMWYVRSIFRGHFISLSDIDAATCVFDTRKYFPMSTLYIRQPCLLPICHRLLKSNDRAKAR